MKKKGSLTVECAAVLPLFLLAFVSILSIFQIMLLEEEVRQQTYETAEEMALVSSLTEENKGGKISEVIAEYGLASVIDTVAMREQIPDKDLFRYVKSGKNGIVCIQVSEPDSDYIELKTSYLVELPVRFFKIGLWPVVENVKVHKWNGYHESQLQTEEEMVYITKEGTVYHRSRECSYLNPSIKAVGQSNLSLLRNSSGAKYYPCEACHPEKSGDYVFYYTTYGESYHCDVNCIGLKRTIYQVPLSKVGNRKACSKCG